MAASEETSYRGGTGATQQDVQCCARGAAVCRNPGARRATPQAALTWLLQGRSPCRGEGPTKITSFTFDLICPLVRMEGCPLADDLAPPKAVVSWRSIMSAC